jgi:hypothetical protein
MADVGLNSAHSRLALSGFTQSRLAFCAGTNHDCTVLVNERGEVVPGRRKTAPSSDYSLETTLVPRRCSPTESAASAQRKPTEERAVVVVVVGPLFNAVDQSITHVQSDFCITISP